MKIHVICAFWRKHLLKTQIHYLESMNIEWHPVCDPIDIQAFENNDKEWIHPVLCPPLNIPGDQCYKKFNNFLDSEEIIDDDYYCFMGDDDSYEPGFFDVIRQQTGKVLMVSMARSGESHLIIRTIWDVQPGLIGLEQYIIKGEIFKQMRFRNDSGYNDGDFAVELIRRFHDDVRLIPHVFVFFNYFKPDLYTYGEWRLKAHWENPRIIE